jgi:hypothetical protein
MTSAPEPLDAPIRVGVFYDGGWFSHLWQWFDEHPEWKAAPAFGGIHDALRWYLHHELAKPMSGIAVTEAHYGFVRV